MTQAGEPTMNDKIKLEGMSIVFANLEDEGFGRSITVAVDEDTEAKITAWVAENKIGKKTPGVPVFKDYEGKKQYSFKISDGTKFAYSEGLDQRHLNFGSTVSLIANAFEYDNKFGKGVSSSLSAVLVTSGAATSADDDMAELMGGTQTTIAEVPDGPVDLSEVPY